MYSMSAVSCSSLTLPWKEGICGEEPELCLRLSRAGWSVHRLDEEMTLHDAATNLEQGRTFQFVINLPKRNK